MRERAIAQAICDAAAQTRTLQSGLLPTIAIAPTLNAPPSGCVGLGGERLVRLAFQKRNGWRLLEQFEAFTRDLSQFRAQIALRTSQEARNVRTGTGHRMLDRCCPRDTARQNNEPRRSAGVKRKPLAQAALTASSSIAKNCFSNASAGIGRPKK